MTMSRPLAVSPRPSTASSNASYTEQGIARAIRFYEYALHAARDIAVVPASMEHGLTVSPDGRTLLYSASAKESGVDLVKLEFN